MKTLTKAIAALSAIPVAGIIALTGAGSAFAITCAPGYVPITFNGIQSCSPTGTGGVGGGTGGSIGGGGSTAPGQAGGIVSGGGYHPPAYVPPTPVKVSAPVVTVSRVGYDRMTVSWKKPSVIGALTGYKITVKQGTRIIRSYTVPSAVTSQVVTGLARRTTYSVVVEADATSQNRKATGKAVSLARSVTTVR